MNNGAWHPDPTGRHQLRWWDGHEWTSTVHDDGVTTDETERIDPGRTEPAVGESPVVEAAVDEPTAARTPPLPPPVAPTLAVDPLPPEVAPTTTPGRARPPVPLILGGAVAVLAVLVVLMLVFVRGGGDEDLVGPGTTEPATTEPPTTQPAVTEPPTTEPPSTQPPATEPPDTTPPPSLDGFEEVTGHIDEATGTFLAVDVTLVPGDAIRFRVEPGPDLDTELFVLAGPETARQVIETFFAFVPIDDRPDDVDSFMEQIRSEGAAGLNPGAAREMFEGRYIVGGNDPGLAGEPDSGFIVVLAPGEYTVLAQAWSGEGAARLIVEISEGRVDLTRDLERYLTEPWRIPQIDPWFDEEEFFRSAAPYTPGIDRPRSAPATPTGVLQEQVAEMVLAEVADEGLAMDAECVRAVAARLSDADAALLIDDPMADISREGGTILIELLGCLDEYP